MSILFRSALTGFFLVAVLTGQPLWAQQGDSAQDQEEITDEDLERALRKWANEYVRWITSDQERAEWKQLSTRREKLVFIETFWRRRDPTPQTAKNEYRSEYLQRWAYVEEHFTAGKPGWRTDRGRIYLMLGPPSSIERNPFGRDRTERPSEVWFYNSINNKALPASVQISFVDFMGYGDYEIVTDLDRTAQFNSAFGISMNNLDAYALRRLGEIRDEEELLYEFNEPTIRHPELFSTDLFELQRELSEISRTPTIDLRPLREEVRTEIASGELLFGLDAKAFRAREENAYLPVTIAVPLKKVSYTESEGVRKYLLDIYARIHGDAGSDAYEESLRIEIPSSQMGEQEGSEYLYQFWFTAAPGRYRLDVTLRDNISNNIGHSRLAIEVPAFAKDGFSVSDILLASQITEIPENRIARTPVALPFQFANRRIIPIVGGEISRAQPEFYIYFHVYHPSTIAQAAAGRVKIEYFFYRDGELFSKTPSALVAKQPSGSTAVQSRFPVANFEAGEFRLVAVVTDEASGESVRGECSFKIVEAPGKID